MKELQGTLGKQIHMMKHFISQCGSGLLIEWPHVRVSCG
jgi:hypothetical protein